MGSDDDDDYQPEEEDNDDSDDQQQKKKKPSESVVAAAAAANGPSPVVEQQQPQPLQPTASTAIGNHKHDHCGVPPPRGSSSSSSSGATPSFYQKHRSLPKTTTTSSKTCRACDFQKALREAERHQLENGGPPLTAKQKKMNVRHEAWCPLKRPTTARPDGSCLLCERLTIHAQAIAAGYAPVAIVGGMHVKSCPQYVAPSRRSRNSTNVGGNSSRDRNNNGDDDDNDYDYQPEEKDNDDSDDQPQQKKKEPSESVVVAAAANGPSPVVEQQAQPTPTANGNHNHDRGVPPRGSSSSSSSGSASSVPKQRGQPTTSSTKTCRACDFQKALREAERHQLETGGPPLTAKQKKMNVRHEAWCPFKRPTTARPDGSCLLCERLTIHAQAVAAGYAPVAIVGGMHVKSCPQYVAPSRRSRNSTNVGEKSSRGRNNKGDDDTICFLCDLKARRQRAYEEGTAPPPNPTPPPLHAKWCPLKINMAPYSTPCRLCYRLEAFHRAVAAGKQPVVVTGVHDWSCRTPGVVPHRERGMIEDEHEACKRCRQIEARNHAVAAGRPPIPNVWAAHLSTCQRQWTVGPTCPLCQQVLNAQGWETVKPVRKSGGHLATCPLHSHATTTAARHTPPPPVETTTTTGTTTTTNSTTITTTTTTTTTTGNKHRLDPESAAMASGASFCQLAAATTTVIVDDEWSGDNNNNDSSNNNNNVLLDQGPEHSPPHAIDGPANKRTRHEPSPFLNAPPMVLPKTPTVGHHHHDAQMDWSSDDDDDAAATGTDGLDFCDDADVEWNPEDLHVPWCRLALHTSWGLDDYRKYYKHSDWRPLEEPDEIDELCGWANHVVSSSQAPPPPQQQQRPTNPFWGVTSPPPPRPSVLRNLIADEAQRITAATMPSDAAVVSAPCGYYTHDQSALVGTGMVLEDMITALLLPYAQAHVKRCRQMDDPDEMNMTTTRKKKTMTTTTTAADYWDEWLLPFDEAIAKLEDDSLTLYTSRPPTRSNVVVVTNDSPVMLEPDRAWKIWCNSQGLDPAFLEKGRNVFSDRSSPARNIGGQEDETMLESDEDDNDDREEESSISPTRASETTYLPLPVQASQEE